MKEGAAKPDISTVDKFREAMLTARSVVHATPGKTPSGIHMGKVLDQLGITDAIAKKVVHKPALEGGAELVASGEAEIGIYPASEVVEVKGVTVVGPLPRGIDPDFYAQLVRALALVEQVEGRSVPTTTPTEPGGDGIF